MNQVILRVAENTPLTENVFRMRLSGDVSAVTAPGQFINIRIRDNYLRRPISVCDVEYEDSSASADVSVDDSRAYAGAGAVSAVESCTASGSSKEHRAVSGYAAKAGTLTIIYKVVGKGTAELSAYAAGEELDVLTGLGNGYDLSLTGDHPLLVGGGVGVPPMYLLAKRLIAEGKKVSVILGFNTASEIFYEQEFKDLGAEVLTATADGSYGIKGFVTDAIPKLSEKPAYICACGPEPMLKALYRASEAGGQYSFEERMGCGFGACMGCTCKTITGYKRICKDGPVMKKEEILWAD